MQQGQPQIDLKNSKGILNSEGGEIFHIGVVAREISKFTIGAKEDAFVPVQVFVDPATQQPLWNSIPMDLREEFKDKAYIPKK